jgi:hypothetical protein
MLVNVLARGAPSAPIGTNNDWQTLSSAAETTAKRGSSGRFTSLWLV